MIICMLSFVSMARAEVYLNRDTGVVEQNPAIVSSIADLNIEAIESEDFNGDLR